MDTDSDTPSSPLTYTSTRVARHSRYYTPRNSSLQPVPPPPRMPRCRRRAGNDVCGGVSTTPSRSSTFNVQHVHSPCSTYPRLHISNPSTQNDAQTRSSAHDANKTHIVGGFSQDKTHQWWSRNDDVNRDRGYLWTRRRAMAHMRAKNPS